jgi:hypothetical protein
VGERGQGRSSRRSPRARLILSGGSSSAAKARGARLVAMSLAARSAHRAGAAPPAAAWSLPTRSFPNVAPGPVVVWWWRRERWWQLALRVQALRGDGHQAADPDFAHQPLHALARDLDPVSEAQLGVNARSAVDLAVGLPDLLDAPRHQLMLARSAVRQLPGMGSARSSRLASSERGADANCLSRSRLTPLEHAKTIAVRPGSGFGGSRRPGTC